MLALLDQIRRTLDIELSRPEIGIQIWCIA